MDGCWMRLFIARRLLQYRVNEWMSESPLWGPRGLASPIPNRICFSVKCWITNDCIRAVFVRLSARSQSGQPWPWDLPLSKANYHRLQCHLSAIHISSTHPFSRGPLPRLRQQRTVRLDNTSQHSSCLRKILYLLPIRVMFKPDPRALEDQGTCPLSTCDAGRPFSLNPRALHILKTTSFTTPFNLNLRALHIQRITSFATSQPFKPCFQSEPVIPTVAYVYVRHIIVVVIRAILTSRLYVS